MTAPSAGPPPDHRTGHRWRARAWFRSRTMTLVLAVFAIVCSMGLVVISPLALPALDGRGEDWQKISNIAQAYGAVSALLSGLAVIGVIVSLILQAREGKASRVQTARAAHTDLIKTAIENPDYLECWGGPDPTRTVLMRRQHMYINLVISYWEMSYEIGDLKDDWLAAVCDEVFTGEIGRSFWERNRAARISTAPTRRLKHFNEIIDERYRRALATPPRTMPALPDYGVPGATPPNPRDPHRPGASAD
ncbi:DUF6082 family protein [Streptomyces sp. NPDC050095]|uniref:DUF6082 family protein n=1 Tax=unclassified Streptomyces TaxID=2593676 RepID=UPI00342472FB